VQAGVHVTDSHSRPRTTQVVANIYRSAGLSGFYAGLSSILLRDVPFSVIQLLLLEHGKNLHQKFLDRPATPLGVAWLAAISGGVAAAMTTPFDVVKTRLMTQTKNMAATASAASSSATSSAVSSSSSSSLTVPYRGAGDALIRVYREEGWRALFSGVQPRVMWISVGGALFFSSFEFFNLQLRQRWGDSEIRK
jgi:solute carrier family 25 S-adenosylmethionine transporter 26